jgi:insulysin
MRTLLSVFISPHRCWNQSYLHSSPAFSGRAARSLAIVFRPASLRTVFSSFQNPRRQSLDTMTKAATTAVSPPSDYIHPRVEVLSSNIEKPELDDRSYRLIRLRDNKLEALLVHDPNTDKSSAAMDVHVGHLSDPKEFPGLAHALEHCLFLGIPMHPNHHLIFYFRHQKVS